MASLTPIWVRVYKQCTAVIPLHARILPKPFTGCQAHALGLLSCHLMSRKQASVSIAAR